MYSGKESISRSSSSQAYRKLSKTTTEARRSKCVFYETLRGQFWAGLLAGCLLMGALAPMAHAATYTVTNLNDSGAGSLRDVISTANGTSADDTINFSVSGTIELSSTLPAIVTTSMGGKLTIDGAGQSIAISGDNSVRVMFVNSDANLTLQNLSIMKGLCGISCNGGGVFSNGTLTISNSTFSVNNAPGDTVAVSSIKG